MEKLLALLDAGRAEPLVPLGDMNEWLPLDPGLRRLRRRLGRAPARATFPARRPLLALDRIWAAPARALGRLAVNASPLAREASDHLPLRAELRLAAAAACRTPRRRWFSRSILPWW